MGLILIISILMNFILFGFLISWALKISQRSMKLMNKLTIKMNSVYYMNKLMYSNRAKNDILEDRA